MHSESEDYVGGFRPGTYVGGFRIPTRAEHDLSVENDCAEYAKSAWHKKLNEYLKILFKQDVTTCNMLQEHFKKPSYYPCPHKLMAPPISEYGPVSDKNTYLLVTLRKVIQNFTYPEGYNHCKPLAVQIVNSRRKEFYSDDLDLFIMNVFPGDGFVQLTLNSEIREEQKLDELKDRFGGAYLFTNNALWDQLLRWLETFLFPVFEDECPTRKERLLALLQSRRLAGFILQQLFSLRLMYYSRSYALQLTTTIWEKPWRLVTTLTMRQGHLVNELAGLALRMLRCWRILGKRMTLLLLRQCR